MLKLKAVGKCAPLELIEKQFFVVIEFSNVSDI